MLLEHVFHQPQQVSHSGDFWIEFQASCFSRFYLFHVYAGTFRLSGDHNFINLSSNP